MKIFVDKKFKSYRTNFQKYTVIGSIFSLLEIFFLWIFIDLLNKPTLRYSIIIIGALTMLKFYSYVMSGMMKNRIFSYMLVLGIFYVLNVVFVWLLVEVIGLSAAFGSAFLTAAFFVFRFFIYDRLHLLRY
ncbi:MAG: hypothetical protein AABX33_04455 [Nanoarchaeota archaeon]